MDQRPRLPLPQFSHFEGRPENIREVPLVPIWNGPRTCHVFDMRISVFMVLGFKDGDWTSRVRLRSSLTYIGSNIVMQSGHLCFHDSVGPKRL